MGWYQKEKQNFKGKQFCGGIGWAAHGALTLRPASFGLQSHGLWGFRKAPPPRLGLC